MVRRIDEQARRRHLAEAVWRIATRDGLSAASVRSVAAESGLATGSVRHFFSTQEQLIVFAMRELTATVQERITRASAVEDPSERVLAILSELLPLRPATYDEALAHLQFTLQARFTPALVPVAEESFAAIDGVCRQVVDWLCEQDALPARTDRAARATRLRAVIDGLTLELLLAPGLMTPEDALRSVRDALEIPR